MGWVMMTSFSISNFRLGLCAESDARQEGEVGERHSSRRDLRETVLLFRVSSLALPRTNKRDAQYTHTHTHTHATCFNIELPYEKNKTPVCVSFITTKYKAL